MQRTVFKSNLGRIQKFIKAGIRAKMSGVKGLVESYLDEKLEGDEGRTGREYLRPDGTPYTASMPGEWPSEKSGDLRRSISSDVVVTNNEVSYTISLDVPYAETLENDMGRLLLGKAYADNIDEIRDIMGKPL